MQLNSLVKKKMAAQSLSVQELAIQADLPYLTVKSLVKGNVRPPRLALMRIAKIFKMPVGDLVKCNHRYQVHFKPPLRIFAKTFF